MAGTPPVCISAPLPQCLGKWGGSTHASPTTSPPPRLGSLAAPQRASVLGSTRDTAQQKVLRFPPTALLGAGGRRQLGHRSCHCKKHRAKFSMGMGTSQAPLGAPSIAPLWSAAGLGPCSMLCLPKSPARGSPEKAARRRALRSSGSLPGQVRKCGSKGGRHTRANNVNTWCLQIMEHDALCWRFGLAWVLFSFSQVHGSFSQHISGAPKFPAEKLG